MARRFDRPRAPQGYFSFRFYHLTAPWRFGESDIVRWLSELILCHLAMIRSWFNSKAFLFNYPRSLWWARRPSRCGTLAQPNTTRFSSVARSASARWSHARKSIPDLGSTPTSYSRPYLECEYGMALPNEYGSLVVRSRAGRV